MTDLEFLKLSKPRKMLYRLGASIASIPSRLGSGLKSLGKRLVALLTGLWNWLKGLVTTFRNGDWKTRLSYLVMGFGSCARGQWGRGLLFFLFQTGYILEKYLKTTTEPSDAKVLPNQQVTKCTSWVSLRKEADTSSERLAKVPLGATVKSCVLTGSFVKCTYGGKTGYILAKYLKDASSTPAADLTGEARVINCTTYVSLRATPDTSATRLSKVPLGAYVIAQGAASNGFVKVEYKGQTGYILGNYLKKTNTGNVALADQKVTGCESWVSLRETASTSAYRIVKVPLGAKVTDCVKNGSFVHCTYKGQTGYILAKYLTKA